MGSIQGETRTEYALIPAALAVVVYGVYEPTGSSSVDSFGGDTDASPIQTCEEQQLRESRETLEGGERE
jgi:hypothetical protein